MAAGPKPSTASAKIFPGSLLVSVVTSFISTNILVPRVASAGFVQSTKLGGYVPVALYLVPFTVSIASGRSIFMPGVRLSLRVSSGIRGGSFFISVVSEATSAAGSRSTGSLCSPTFGFPLVSTTTSTIVFSLRADLSGFLTVLSVPPYTRSDLVSRAIASWPFMTGTLTVP